MTPVVAKLQTEDITEAMATTLASIGERIRKARLAREMTLQDLADISGVSPSMLSLVERGRVAPSVGSLIVIAEALGVAMSDLVAAQSVQKERIVVRPSDQRVIEHAKHVVRRLLREDSARGVSVAISEFPPNTDSAPIALSHTGYEFGFVLDGRLTVEIEGKSYIVEKGDLISYSSRRSHRIWNHGKRNARAIWFNLRSE
jgi:transcriptional regulator with XRE-family HTH domain